MWRPPITCSNDTLRIGPLVAAVRRRAHRLEDPRIDGARIHYVRGDATSIVEEFDAGGYEFRLWRSRGGLGDRAHGVAVGLRGHRIPNPQWSRLTARGRQYRRRQQEWIAAGRPANPQAGVATSRR